MKTKKTSKTPKTDTPKIDTPKVETPKVEKPAAARVTKKTICIEMVSRPEGATLDQMAQEIADRGICADLKVNRTTCALWMSKIGFKVAYDKESKIYRKA